MQAGQGTSEQGIVQYGETSIPYTVRRSRRRKKTMQLTVDVASGVVVAAPMNVPPREIESFVEKRAAWIANRLSDCAQAAPRIEFRNGDWLPYLGQQVQMTVEDVIGLRRPLVDFTNGVIAVTVPPDLGVDERHDTVRAAVLGWYRKQAEQHLLTTVERWGSIMGLEPGRVSIRDQKRRWGSCSADGSLRFNWRAVTLEPSLADYIVVHELAHLAIRNHSPEFWNLVLKTMPDANQRRKRLREEASRIRV